MVKNIGCFYKKVFWLGFVTIFLLAIPFVLMKLSIPLYDPGSGFEILNWDLSDFVIMGVLIFGTLSLFFLAARRVTKKSHRIVLATVLLLGFLWLWAELAVGVFTNWGS